jgi:hypothetical protein
MEMEQQIYAVYPLAMEYGLLLAVIFLVMLIPVALLEVFLQREVGILGLGMIPIKKESAVTPQ